MYLKLDTGLTLGFILLFSGLINSFMFGLINYNNLSVEYVNLNMSIISNDSQFISQKQNNYFLNINNITNEININFNKWIISFFFLDCIALLFYPISMGIIYYITTLSFNRFNISAYLYDRFLEVSFSILFFCLFILPNLGLFILSLIGCAYYSNKNNVSDSRWNNEYLMASCLLNVIVYAVSIIIGVYKCHQHPRAYFKFGRRMDQYNTIN
jgi:hypothetical protein